MSKPTDRALAFVRQQDSAAEVRLMEAAPNDSQRILPSANLVRSSQHDFCCQAVSMLRQARPRIDGCRLLIDQPDREDRFVERRSDTDEPGQRLPEFHRRAECNVVGRLGVGSPPLVARIAVGTDVVLVGTILRTFAIGGQDREGGWVPLKDSNTAHVLLQRDPAALEGERPGDPPLTMPPVLAVSGQEGERGRTEFVVLVDRSHARSIAQPGEPAQADGLW